MAGLRSSASGGDEIGSVANSCDKLAANESWFC